MEKTNHQKVRNRLSSGTFPKRRDPRIEAMAVLKGESGWVSREGVRKGSGIEPSPTAEHRSIVSH